ncbi:odorant receptor 67d-like [Uranotaenia lowii]|uniref:odorant receptor 67d-like n=1 Tax=Uranotaenia lowii TaxID=190385 RepID=UPI00247887F0|nr:odorant receptor 67d-like [Uranotaenia lowii]
MSSVKLTHIQHKSNISFGFAMNIKRRIREQFWLLDKETQDKQRCVDVLEDVVGFVRTCCRNIGGDVLDSNFRINFRTILLILSMNSYFICLGYSVYCYWGSWFEILEALSLAGVAVQGMVKLNLALSQKEYFQSSLGRLQLMYERNVHHPRNNRSLVSCGGLIRAAFIIFALFYFLGGVGFCLLPLYTFARYQQRTMILAVLVPGFDPETHFGFVATSAYHVFLIFMGTYGSLAADLGMMLITFNIIGIVDIFKNLLKELDDMLELDDFNERKIHESVLQVCVAHKEVIAYEEALDKSYRRVVFVQVMTSVAILSTTLFVFYMTMQIANLLFMLAAILQLLEFCILGVTITIKNDQIVRALYDIRWYKLPVKQQRILSFILFKSQNAVEMTIGGLAELNMSTFVEIVKTIYTYFAMMIQFIH